MSSKNASHKLLITGGLGFIGSSLIAFLNKRHGDKISISVLDDFSVGSLADLANALHCPLPNDHDQEKKQYLVDRVVVYKDNISSVTNSHEAIQDADTIVHLAAQTSVPESVLNPEEDFSLNVVGFFNILNIARQAPKMPKIVFSSSNAPLGYAEQPVSELSLPSPISPYGASKLIAETYLRAFNESYGLRSVALRFGNVYGPGSLYKSSVVAKFIRQALNGESLEIYGDGTQTRDFIYIDDLTHAIEKSIFLDNEKFELFQISAGEEMDIHTLTLSICKAFETAGLDRPEFKFGAERKGDMARNVSDVSKARDVLNWQVEQELEAGIGKTLAWFLEQDAIAETD